MRALAWFLGLFVFALAAAALLAWPAWTLLHPHFDFPFHRIAERIGMLALLAGFLLLARRLRLADRASLGYGLPRRAFLRELGLGAAIGVASMAGVVALMAALGLIEWTAPEPGARRRLGGGVGRCARSGPLGGLREEGAPGGAVHRGAGRGSGRRAAVLGSARL